MSADKTVVLITGANSGIGFDTCAAFAEASSEYHVILSSRSLEKGQKALDELRSQNTLRGTISLLQLDVTDGDSINRARQHIEQQFGGRLDVLINNAGIISSESDLLANLRQTFETNTFGPAIVIKTFVPLLKKSAKPRIVYISLCGDPSYKHYRNPHLTYRMSKAALNLLSVYHQIEFESWGCKVCAYNPGYAVTNLTGEAGRAIRIKNGARPSTESAKYLLEIAQGKKDGDVGGIVDVDGGVRPW